MHQTSAKFQTVKTETLLTLKLGAPVVITQLLAMSMNFTDTVMAGNLSARDLAAVAIGGALVAPLFVFTIGVILIINPIVAQHLGGKKHDEIGKIFWQGVWLSIMLAIPFFFALRNMQPIMKMFGLDPQMYDITSGYLRAYSWGIPASTLFFMMRYFNEGLGVMKPAMYFSIIGLVVNIIGNYAFMYGHFGMPALGAIGTGWATAIVWWVMACCIALFSFQTENNRRFRLFHHFRLPLWTYFIEILHIGFPNGISFCIEVTMFAVVALIIGSLGVNPMAAHQITINFAATTFMIPLGLSIATTSRVGFAVGEADPAKARLLGFIGISLSAIIMSMTALLMISVPEFIVHIYTDDNAVKEIAVKLLFLAGVFQISDGLQVSASGALRGLKDTKIPMIVNLISYWMVGMPLGYFLGIRFGLGVEGLWMGLIAGLTVAAGLHNWRFYRISKVAEALPLAVQKEII